MMPSEVKKLKRGLGDVSYFFRPLDGPETNVPVQEIPRKRVTVEKPVNFNIFSTVSADCPEDSFLFNALIARAFVNQGAPATVLDLRSRTKTRFPFQSRHRTQTNFIERELFDESLRLVTLSTEACESVCGNRKSKIFPAIRNHNVFLNIDLNEPQGLFRWASLTDSLFLVLRPRFQSLKESYRLLKWWSLNQFVNSFYVFYEGPREDERGAQIYEQLALIASENLGVHVQWGGCLDLSPGLSQMSVDIDLQCFENREGNFSFVEKMRLMNYLTREFSPHEPAVAPA